MTLLTLFTFPPVSLFWQQICHSTNPESGRNQVLANFVQSLLNKKGGDGASRSAVASELNKL
jgi:hypothetical protein